MRSWKAVESAKGAPQSVLRGLTSLILAGVLCVPVAWGAPNQGPLPGPQPAQQPGPQQGPQLGPQPGMVNYFEGQASLAGQPLTQNSMGSARSQGGQSAATQNGRVEILLTPGVLLRLDHNSAVLMNSAEIPDTELTVQGGRAMVEADQILPANHIVIHAGAGSVRLMKSGLYDFDAVQGLVRVFDGHVEVSLAGKTFNVERGHEFDMNAAKPKARGFDMKAAEDNFYRWGSLRSSYLAEANADAARGFAQGYYGPGPAYAGYGSGYGYGYAGYYGPYGPGWFWDPYFSAYTWLPYDGVFFSPFGWGFYSPGFAYVAPFYGRGGYHAFGPGYRPSAAAVQAAAHGAAMERAGGSAFAGGGVRSAGGFGGGGFGGGGFHGGGGFGGGGGRR
jgi:hypothetical protein